MKQRTIRTIIKRSEEALIQAGKADFLVDIEWLLCEVLSTSRTELSLLQGNDLTQEQYGLFEGYLNRRLMGEPLQQILGSQSFYGLDFKVNQHVLIPRFETEELVEKAIKWCRSNEATHLLDLCTGSGCIGLTMLHECPDLYGTLVDLSSDALKVAKANTIQLCLGERTTLLKSDLFNALPIRKYDIIVSNPPYIETDFIEGLSDEVKGSEPYMALDGGEDGLKFYRKIIHEAKDYLKKDGLLIFEIGYNQLAAVKELFVNEGYCTIKGYQDMSGKDRIVLATR